MLNYYCNTFKITIYKKNFIFYVATTFSKEIKSILEEKSSHVIIDIIYNLIKTDLINKIISKSNMMHEQNQCKFCQKQVLLE